MDDQDIIQEFLIESGENLARLDLEMVELERQPKNRELLSSVFRTIHTIKGTCGFFGYSRLETLAHVAEDILSDLRNGRRDLDAALTTLILESVDAIKRILNSIETASNEGEPFEGELLERLKQARDCKPAATSPEASETLPAESSCKTWSAVSGSEPRRIPMERALVVDDSRAIRLILSKALTELGFDVVQTASGKEALETLEREGAQFRLALVDWNMPEVTGLELVQRVRAMPAVDRMRVMMVTTETEVEQVMRALEAGADEYVMKPFTREAVEDKLRLMGVIQ
jgi:two-component system, chemotaxis family, chemotaxis protein CheY